MAFTSEQRVGQLAIDEQQNISVRVDTVILADGVEVARKYLRVLYAPDTDVSALHPAAAKIAPLFWTPAVVQAAKARRAALLAAPPATGGPV